MATVVKDVTYVAELKLPRIPFMNVKKKAEAKFLELGFSDVRVWDASDGKTYGEGTWRGETTEVDLPDQIVRYWKK